MGSHKGDRGGSHLQMEVEEHSTIEMNESLRCILLFVIGEYDLQSTRVECRFLTSDVRNRSWSSRMVREEQRKSGKSEKRKKEEGANVISFTDGRKRQKKLIYPILSRDRACSRQRLLMRT